MDPTALLELQLETQRMAIHNGCLTRIAGPDPEDIPLYAVLKLGGKHHGYARADAPSALRAALDEIPPALAFRNRHLVAGIISEHGYTARWDAGRSYVVPQDLELPTHPAVRRLGPQDQDTINRFDPLMGRLAKRRPVHAVVMDGAVVAACASIQETTRAAEAWVRTAPSHRQAGFGKQVTSAWATDVRSQGKVAFYSHRLVNRASRGIARSLGLHEWMKTRVWFYEGAPDER